jgi:hypothetical protein
MQRVTTWKDAKTGNKLPVGLAREVRGFVSGFATAFALEMHK